MIIIREGIKTAEPIQPSLSLKSLLQAGASMARHIYSFIIIALFGLAVSTVVLFYNLETKRPQLTYNAFLKNLASNEIAKVHLKGGNIALTDIYGRESSTFSPDISAILPILAEKKVVITAEDDRSAAYFSLLFTTLPVCILLVAAWMFSSRKQAGDKKEESEFVKNKIIDFSSQAKPVTFDDVAGIPEAKEELREIVDFLKNPQRFKRLGAIIPKGVLLQGPPGTGKTLLAKAIAGEAKVPFYSFSGSDFVEMFVGVGASRVRDLFNDAKKHKPCIVFIDEIDAVGAHRSAAGAAGGQDERGQTLNALLVEMDGFGRDDTIIILAATNRPDILDPALTRPGRFDRQITILPPDVKGRLKILQVHVSRVIINENVDLNEIAQNTPGFTGAELANLVNEAALIAARTNKAAIEDGDFDIARDRMLMGIERKGMIISKHDRRTMAFHEAGHAIVARFLPDADPIHKISIIPRGRAMGHTQQLPLHDTHAYTKDYLLARITILMGGRAAEEVGLCQQSTGAEDDVSRATKLATKMVCQWGMNNVVGPLAYIQGDNGFLGGDTASHAVYSETTARHIDHEIRKIIERCYQEAHAILLNKKAFLCHLANTLLQTETLDNEEIEIIFQCSQHKENGEEAGDIAAGSQPSGTQKNQACSACPTSSHCVQRPELAERKV
jgi:cell division protease FtsH